jgi:hypothetical protein
MSTLTLQPAEAAAVDCYIGSGTAAGTAFDNGLLNVGSFFFGGNTTYYRSLTRFDLSTLADGAIPSACEMTLTWDGGSPVNPGTYTAYRLTRTNWTEAATWTTYDGSTAWTSNGGDYSVTGSDAYIYAGTGTTLTFDLLAMLVDAMNAGLSSLNVIVIGPEADGSSNYVVGLSSAETTAAERPKLEITYDLSVHQQCANAAKTVIDALELPGLPTASVIVRKAPWHRPESDPKPAIILSTHLPSGQVAATNLRDDITYPVTVNFYSPSDGSPTLNQGRMLSWREKVRKAFHQQRLSGVDSVWQCTIPPSQPFNRRRFGDGHARRIAFNAQLHLPRIQGLKQWPHPTPQSAINSRWTRACRASATSIRARNNMSS